MFCGRLFGRLCARFCFRVRHGFCRSFGHRQFGYLGNGFEIFFFFLLFFELRIDLSLIHI